MNLTVESIKQAMEQTYFEQTGLPVDGASDVGVRFSILATELFSLKTYGDFILKQAFAQTATGTYLDLQCQLRGLERHTPTHANGKLGFSLAQVATTETEIPIGTICASAAQPYLRFATTLKRVIPIGALSVDVPARALDVGEAYNVVEGTVTLMVTPPTGIAKVNNEEPFFGGYTLEGDRALRARLLQNLRFHPNGFNKQSYRERLLTLSEVVDVNAYQDTTFEELVIVVRSKSDSLSTTLRNQMRALLNESLLSPFTINFATAQRKETTLRTLVYVENGYEKEAVCQMIKQNILEQCSALQIGDTLFPAKIGNVVCSLEGVRNFQFATDDTPIVSGPKEYLYVNAVEVVADEW